MDHWRSVARRNLNPTWEEVAAGGVNATESQKESNPWSF